MYDLAPAATPTLHAASRRYVVVFYRPDIGNDARAALRALNRAAVDTQAPVLIVPRRQRAAR